MDAVLDKTGRLNANVEVGKFSVLIAAVGTYKDGVDVPSGANVGPVVGVAQESILPNGFNDYSGGQYQITSGTAWPANAVPASAGGRSIGYRMLGISRAICSGVAINVGDHLNIGDNAGRVKTITETGATMINEVGWAIDAGSTANDILRILVMPVRRGANTLG